MPDSTGGGGPSAAPSGGATDVAARDAVSLLRGLEPHRVPDAVLESARACGAESAALYLVDIDGSCLLKLAGDAGFPAAISVPLGVGPELPVEAIGQVAARVGIDSPGATTVAMRVRDRAIGVLVTRGGDVERLQTLTDRAGLALELANGYGDVMHRARRRRSVEPAAEIQQNLMPPRIATFERGSLAGGVLPGYDVGGDFFDYAANPEGLWLAVGDAMGKGTAAAAMSSIALGALRAARRNGDDLPAMARLIHETVIDLSRGESFLTAILMMYDADAGMLRWINCGHPRPLVLHGRGRFEQLDAGTYPLGLFDRRRSFEVAEHRLGAGGRLLLYSDGVSERRDAEGRPMGVEWVASLLSETAAMTASSAIRRIQDAVVDASRQPLRDDATLLLLAAH